MKKVCVLLASGCEEVEAITPIDYLRRAGIEVIGAGIDSLEICGAHGLVFMAQTTMEHISNDDFDCVVVPGGGPGSQAIADNLAAVAFIQRHHAAGKLIAAICAAPALVLGQACGLLSGRRFTCYPGMESRVPEGIFSAARVVTDGSFITSRGPGCAGEFSLAIVRMLVGTAMADQLAAATLQAQP
jgi:4-methyl-5(b-hydroxyethyl)-thiazole monophosphate biosynthesis